MQNVPARQGMAPDTGYRRGLSILLWIALITGWAVSVFSVIEEMCMVSACRDTASFTFFKINIGWLGIAYFSTILVLFWFRRSVSLLDWAATAMIFSGIGAEFRLLWIQKYIIGNWCPLCVTICISLFIAAILFVIEKWQTVGALKMPGKSLAGWVAFVVVMVITGFAVAFIGVQALT
jgi:hypothetical protein